MRSQCRPRDDARAAAGRVRAAGSLEQTEPVLPLVLGPASGGKRSGRRHEKLARGVSLARCAARRYRKATGLAAAMIRSATRALFQRTGTPQGKEKTSSIGI